MEGVNSTLVVKPSCPLLGVDMLLRVEMLLEAACLDYVRLNTDDSRRKVILFVVQTWCKLGALSMILLRYQSIKPNEPWKE